MDAAEATLYGAAIAGVFTLLGVVVGVFGERWARTWGEVRCVIGVVRYNPLWIARIGAATQPAEELPDSGSNDWGDLYVEWTLELRFFNDKDEPTGLHAVSVAFLNGAGEKVVIGPLRDVPKRSRSQRLGVDASQEDLVNLPSQQWARIPVRGSFRIEKAVMSLRWERIEVWAEYPNGTPYVQEVANRRGLSEEQLRADYAPTSR